ncbi:hypothetical protein Shpa_10 [Paracoccus phage Shpa]|uniref:Uncharacterized protein n=1 Tax=Paracoccus phage Shpa TaxID=1647282 RepID=A0A0U2C0P4_9CAUD|nr:tail completion or Neck1 protein [Paracoccus phage Shpa]AKG94521.1 hypothetical protein Shpa_10 [Paracoccus phage Shpa]
MKPAIGGIKPEDEAPGHAGSRGVGADAAQVRPSGPGQSSFAFAVLSAAGLNIGGRGVSNTTHVSLSGLKELDERMSNLTRGMQRGALRSALMKAAKPLVEIAKHKAPVKSGKLRDSIMVGAKLNSRQAKLHRRMFRDDRSSIELFVGPSYLMGGGGRHGHLLEFGTRKMAAQPFMRPAWDQDREAMLERIGDELRLSIDRAIARAARKAARES